MRKFLCLVGLACCMMALALFSTADNALTPPGKTADQTALAIQPAPIASLGDNVAALNQVAMLNKGAPDIAAISLATQITPDEMQLALATGENAITTSSRSMPLKISVTAALNTNLANDSTATTTAITDNPVATTRSAPNIDAWALACGCGFPNPFNHSDTGITEQTEMTLTVDTALATDGGQKPCRAVNAGSSLAAGLVGNFELKMAA